MDKIISFDIFRFHLLPITTKQISLFGEQMTYEELVKKKNELFESMVQDLQNRQNQFPLELFSSEGSFYLFRLANPKKTIIYKDFKAIVENTEPYIYISINTDSEVQKIGISHNPDAFSSTSVSKNLIAGIFNHYLEQQGLLIQMEQIFESSTFWKYTEEYEGRIKAIDFEIVKPNLSKISRTIRDTLKPLIENTNSHSTHLALNAPANGVLENINKNNQQINGLVDYSSEGGGNISLKVIGLNKKLKTKDMAKSVKIREVQIEGSPDQVIKVWKDIVE